MNPAGETRPPDIDVDVQIHWCAAHTPDAATGRVSLWTWGCFGGSAVSGGGGGRWDQTPKTRRSGLWSIWYFWV